MFEPIHLARVKIFQFLSIVRELQLLYFTVEALPKGESFYNSSWANFFFRITRYVQIDGILQNKEGAYAARCLFYFFLINSFIITLSLLFWPKRKITEKYSTFFNQLGWLVSIVAFYFSNILILPAFQSAIFYWTCHSKSSYHSDSENSCQSIQFAANKYLSILLVLMVCFNTWAIVSLSRDMNPFLRKSFSGPDKQTYIQLLFQPLVATSLYLIDLRWLRIVNMFLMAAFNLATVVYEILVPSTYNREGHLFIFFRKVIFSWLSLCGPLFYVAFE